MSVCREDLENGGIKFHKKNFKTLFHFYNDIEQRENNSHVSNETGNSTRSRR